MRGAFAMMALAGGVLLSANAWATEQQPEKADGRPKIAAGLMMQQGGKLVMAPCRDRSYAIVEDVSDGQKVVETLNLIGLAEGKHLYAELIGVLDGGSLRASDVNMARVAGRCQQPGGGEENWRAAGTGWSLVASATHLRLNRMGQPDLLLAAKTQGDDKAAQIDAESTGQKIGVHLKRERCRDQAANAVFGWTAQVTVDGKLLQGCAWQR
ncbi:hypothetical protein [Azonexus sp. IMCC34839]|uniref:hypothetical protein n=1 Tax=Azonexus sp. IMCC34839 TaxID=3133695 RepID=UPI0039996997